MTTQLSLYNEALRLNGERILSSLTETRESRRILDSIWDDDLVDYVLEQGIWNFATRTQKYTYSPSIDPDFGYKYAFNKPDDLIRTAKISFDEYFNVPLTQYEEDTGYWFAEYDEIYISYVSNDDQYGGDFSVWPKTFSKYVAAYIAEELSIALNKSETRHAKLIKLKKDRLKEARSRDALESPTMFPPMGGWASTRIRGVSNNFDRGNRGNLVG